MLFAGLIKAVRIQMTFLRQANRPEVTGEAREVSLVASGSDGIRIRQALSLGEIVDDMVPRMGWMAIQRRAASQRKCVATEYFEQDKEYKWSPLYPTRSNRP